MALLRDGDLTLEIAYTSFRHGWVGYRFACRWDGRPIFDDAPMKRHNEWWDARPPGQFIGNEDGACCLIPFLDRVLRTREADFVEPLDPDFALAIYPHDRFPFLPPKGKIIYMSDDYKAEQAALAEARAAAGGILDDDHVELVIRFDAYQFRDSIYSGSGPALHMQPEWGELRRFAAELWAEWKAWSALHGVFARIGPGDDEPPARPWWTVRMNDPDWTPGVPEPSADPQD